MKGVSNIQRRLFLVLASMVGILLLLHVLAVWVSTYHSATALARFMPLLDMDVEYNVPTAASASIFLVSAVLAASTALRQPAKQSRLLWGVLASMLLYFGLDEFLLIHEQLAMPLRNLLAIQNDSLLFHAWVIPAGLVAVVLGLLFLRHAKQLKVSDPRGFRLFRAIVVFVIGAVALEMIGTRFFLSVNIYRYIVVPVEELFELGMGSYFLVTAFVANAQSSRKMLGLREKSQ